MQEIVKKLEAMRGRENWKYDNIFTEAADEIRHLREKTAMPPHQETTLHCWDVISIRDRFATLSDCLEVPPSDPELLAQELESIAAWFRLTK